MAEDSRRFAAGSLIAGEEQPAAGTSLRWTSSLPPHQPTMALIHLGLTLFISLIASGVVLGQFQEQQLQQPQQQFAPAAEDISNTCIGCICEASSQCNISASCTSDMCGPFRITRPYWFDAGSPILPGDNVANPDAWTNCVRDPQCAGQAVFNYLTRFRKDCNNDGKISCMDYAMIHHLGGYGCGTRDLEARYRAQLEPCLFSIGQLN